MTQAESFSLSGQTGAHSASNSFLAGGGEMGERIRAFNWASTSLGPVDEWPQNLKTIVRIMLTSRQPIWIGWGPELIKLYNAPYKSIVGGKHPDALGQLRLSSGGKFGMILVHAYRQRCKITRVPMMSRCF